MTCSDASGVPISKTVLLGRQAIFDRKRRTYGYALLYRNGESNESFFADPDHATNTVLELTMLEWGFDRVVGDRYGFVHVSTQFLTAKLLALLPPGRAVAVLDNANISEGALEAIRAGVARGLRFALNNAQDFAPSQAAQIADVFAFVRIDMLSMSKLELGKVVKRTKKLFPQAQLIAGKVEDSAQFADALGAGFDLFQGYFFAKPEVMQRRKRASSSPPALQLMAVINKPNVELDEVAEVVSTDATLAYEFLRLVNSTAHGMPIKVHSISHAVALVGIAEVRRFSMLLAMTLSTRAISDELLVLSATRARMAEALAGDDAALAAGAFTAGLLSVIDVVFATPMEELLADLPLLRPVRDALLFGAGDIGQILAAIYAFEHADTQALERLHPGASVALMNALAEGAATGEELRSQMPAR